MGARMPAAGETLAVLLVGHGAPALDCPMEWVGELMSLEWRQHGGGHHHGAPAGHHPPHGDGQAPSGRAAELDAKIRDWPRRTDNDPYKAGLEQLAEALRPLLPTSLFAIAYNEFCRPSIPQAIAALAAQGARRLIVIPSMLTPGGVHSEIDIPHALGAARQAHPQMTIDYLWPFDLAQVAGLLAAHVRRAQPVAGA